MASNICRTLPSRRAGTFKSGTGLTRRDPAGLMHLNVPPMPVGIVSHNPRNRR